MKQAKNTGIGERDSEGYRSSDSEGDYEGDQQAPQVLPTPPFDPAAAINGLHSGFLLCFPQVPVRFSLYPR
jgi:hypothetical protein